MLGRQLIAGFKSGLPLMAEKELRVCLSTLLFTKDRLFCKTIFMLKLSWQKSKYPIDIWSEFENFTSRFFQKSKFQDSWEI